MNQSLQHLFSQIPRADIQRSVFNRHHTVKTAFDTGYLVPFYVDEALPGDTFSMDVSSFCRLSTMAVPIMDNLYMETFFFFVPNRLIWNNWQKFCGEQENPGDSTDYVVPTFQDATSFSVGNLGDYFGIPTGVALDNVSCLWHRAYNLIWNEWFRDENLQDSVKVNKDDGPDDPSDYTLLKRGKRHDYFTSCLPWPQKGPGVEIPLGTTAPVYGDNSASYFTYFNSGSAITSLPNNIWRLQSISDTSQGMGRSASSYVPWFIDKDRAVANDIGTGLYADLSDATAANINTLRQAFQIQRLYEADARGGTRYTEILRSHFGVVSPDARLQRPEYLGGSSTRINVHPVAQTSSTDATSPASNLTAFATAGDVGHVFTKSFVEHGVLIGLVNIRADLTYQQGLNRMFSRRTRFDYYWPTLAHLGEQAVLNKEIYAQADTVVDAQGNNVNNKVFGYQERFAEYRYKPSIITGKMRSTDANSLDVWHLAQKFNSLPALNSSFIEENVPLDRVLAVTDEPQIIADFDLNLKTVRPLPVYSVPGLIDHF